MSATGTTFQPLEHQVSHAYVEELEHLATRELPRFWRHANRQLENAHDAEDAVQDALVSAYKNLSQFRGTAQLSTWFTTIVTNAARMQRRRRRPHVSIEEQLGSAEDGLTLLDTFEDHRPDPEEVYSKSELLHRLAKAIDQLSPTSRRAIRSYYVDGKSIVGISEALGIPEGTVKAQLARGRARLAILLRRDLGLRASASRVRKTRVAQ